MEQCAFHRGSQSHPGISFACSGEGEGFGSGLCARILLSRLYEIKYICAEPVVPPCAANHVCPVKELSQHTSSSVLPQFPLQRTLGRGYLCLGKGVGAVFRLPGLCTWDTVHW